MKSVMYHYVQNNNPNYKFFNFLSLRNFEKQIKYFKKKFKIEDAKKLFEIKKLNKNSVFLTFDDGLKCHYDYVFPVLKKHGVNGIFYIPALSYKKKNILDVHKIHLILGKFGPIKANKLLIQLLEKKMINKRFYKKFNNQFYLSQDNHNDEHFFKSTLNFTIKNEYKTILIKKIFRYFFNDQEKKIFDNFYLNKKQIKKMQSENMVIGSHGVSHTLLTRLNKNELKKEIDLSLNFVNQFTKLKTFSYPYGGKSSYNNMIISYLNKKKVSFSFSVENKDIGLYDLSKKRQTLPRYDCNQFIYGKININKFSQSK
jgi:peptidoglycan/xylan/chitin deacetylase (PgdA/CDA1 family)